MQQGLVFCGAGNICPSSAEPTEQALSYGCSACQYIKNNKVSSCSNFVKLNGIDPTDSTKVFDEWGCAIAFVPIMLVEVSSTNRGKTQALESFRNETIKRQDVALKLVSEYGTRQISKD